MLTINAQKFDYWLALFVGEVQGVQERQSFLNQILHKPIPAVGWVQWILIRPEDQLHPRVVALFGQNAVGFGALIGSNHFVIKYRRPNGLAGASLQTNLTNVNISEAWHRILETTALDLLPTIAQHGL